MGFLADKLQQKAETAPVATAEGDPAPAKKNGFMSLLGDYAKSRMPIMYGLGQEAFGSDQAPPIQGGTGPGLEPLPQMPQPKGAGNLILKLMGAG